LPDRTSVVVSVLLTLAVARMFAAAVDVGVDLSHSTPDFQP
jgi:hypothetical protein